MKHKSSFVIVYWWLLLLLLGGGLLLAFAEKEERVSQTENRMLSGFPEFSLETLASGEFFLGIESYLSDGVWGRDAIVGVSESILGLFNGNTLEEQELLENAAMLEQLQWVTDTQETASEEAASDSQAPSQETAPLSEQAPQEAQTVSRVEDLTGYGLWRIRKDGSYVRFVTGNEGDVQAVAQVLNQFRACLPEDGNLFYTNVPVASTALGAKQEYVGWYDNIDVGLGKYVDDGIHILNVPAILEEPLWAGEHLFYASDHHWTPQAAALTANECARLLGFPVVPYEEYEYSLHSFPSTNPYGSDDLELMHPLQPAEGRHMNQGREGDSRVLINYNLPTYRAFLDGDSTIWLRYTTGFSTGRKALVIGDSFSNAFTPYLMPYYDEVYKIDIRNYEPQPNGGNMAKLMAQYGIDDVYIIVCQPNGITAEMSKSNLESALHG